MSDLTYKGGAVGVGGDKPLVWLRGEIKTPPLSRDARLEAGVLLRRLQKGEALSMPHSRAMPSIGPRCCELRIPDRDQTWRIIYRIDPDAIVIVDVFSKKTRQTAVSVIENCQRRLKGYDRIR
jgi:phage-related protein